MTEILTWVTWPGFKLILLRDPESSFHHTHPTWIHRNEKVVRIHGLQTCCENEPHEMSNARRCQLGLRGRAARWEEKPMAAAAVPKQLCRQNEFSVLSFSFYLAFEGKEKCGVLRMGHLVLLNQSSSRVKTGPVISLWCPELDWVVPCNSLRGKRISHTKLHSNCP